MFNILWQFETTDGLAPAFVTAYGPSGGWIQFFRRAPGYVGTDLFRRSDSPPCFLTLDRWETRMAYEAFRRERGPEYAALDAECEALTTGERFLVAWED